MEQQPGQRRKPIANGNERRKLCQIALINPLKPANFLNIHLEYWGNFTLSVRNVQRYLHESGIVKLFLKPVLNFTPVHKQTKIDCCDRNINEFTTTFLTDEANLSFHRMQGKRWSAGTPREILRPKFPKTLMICNKISTMSPTNNSIIRGTIHNFCYIQILEDSLPTCLRIVQRSIEISAK